ncbi:MAG: hypothetical protein HOW73_37635 [Polyangiaceae bacterium]|nr:hypothetical protein [Polyangiaceae bacterium]
MTTSPPSAARVATCTEKSSELDCWRVAKAGGAGAHEATQRLLTECEESQRTIACAAAADLSASTMSTDKLAVTSERGCHKIADSDDEAKLQGEACARAGDARARRGQLLFAAMLYGTGCALDHKPSCEAGLRNRSALEREGRAIDGVQFNMEGIADSDEVAYHVSDIGCRLEKSVDMFTFFGQVGLPFFDGKKKLANCVGAYGRVPVRWRTHGGKITDVHASGPLASCVEQALAGAPSPLHAICGAVIEGSATTP